MTMKNLIRQALIAVVFLLSLSSMAQDREDKVLLTFEKKSEKLTEATGWETNDLGKWISRKNIIESQEGAVDTSKTHNFYWMQMGTVKYLGKRYYVLFYSVLSGSYTYPELKMDWYRYKKTESIIIPQSVYDSLRHTISAKSGENVFVVTPYRRVEVRGEYDEAKLMMEIEARISNKPSEIESMEFVVNSQALKGNDVVRFQLPKSASLSQFSRKLDEDNAKERYFEVPASIFKKLLID